MRPCLPLLLHMHQPDYIDPVSGEPVMPWVRKHALRGYTDVPTLALEAAVRFTCNVVPSLVDQLQRYAEGGTDRWEQIAATPAESLGSAEVAFMRSRFVHGHPAMRRVSPRFRALEAQIATLSHPQDLRDLAVWSHLAWIGVVGRRSPFVQSLLRQDAHFSHAQLTDLLAFCRELVAGVLPLWRRMDADISFTPYTQPILPLLINTEHARRAMPHLPDDLHFAYPDDAERHIVEGRSRIEAAFGVRPSGMWPSEGSVSPEVAALAGRLGLRWMATDEGVLQRSQRDAPASTASAWEVEQTGLTMVFRDRELSDRIGFVYASWQGKAAAADLLERASVQPITPIILDGENPWESYRDAGEDFLTHLFASGAVCSVEEALPQMPRQRITHLHSGSWINANFAIWAGDAADRAAWRKLLAVRKVYEAAGRPAAAWPHLRAAEGSDWFWWFGPEHRSEMHDLFEGLFEAHLQATLAACRRG